MRLYAIVGYAHKTTSEKTVTRCFPGYTMAHSKEEATVRAILSAREMFPEGEGWGYHTGAAVEIGDELIDKYISQRGPGE